jgi:hypothetical protein
MDKSGMVEMTREEFAAWMIARGSATYCETPDGRIYRVLEPNERRDELSLSSSKDKEG